MNKGYTILELMLVLAVVGILAAVAVPGFQDSIRRNARDSALLDLRSSLSFARSQAVDLSSTVSVCRSSNQSTCVGTASGDWNVGWIVFADRGTAGTVDAGDSLLQVHSALSDQGVIDLADGAGAAVSDDFLQFDEDGFLENSSNGAFFKYCDPDNLAANARAVWVSNTGRATLSVDDAGDGVHNDLSGADLVCP